LAKSHSVRSFEHGLFLLPFSMCTASPLLVHGSSDLILCCIASSVSQASVRDTRGMQTSLNFMVNCTDDSNAIPGDKFYLLFCTFKRDRLFLGYEHMCTFRRFYFY
jgi:hypothetical protein